MSSCNTLGDLLRALSILLLQLSVVSTTPCSGGVKDPAMVERSSVDNLDKQRSAKARGTSVSRDTA